MIFLIEYNRSKGRIIQLLKFRDSERRIAQGARLNLELGSLHNKTDNEIVLLQAKDEESLHRTHQRYFKEAAEIRST
jgi:hypothetical protein